MGVKKRETTRRVRGSWKPTTGLTQVLAPSPARLNCRARSDGERRAEGLGDLEVWQTPAGEPPGGGGRRGASPTSETPPRTLPTSSTAAGSRRLPSPLLSLAQEKACTEFPGEYTVATARAGTKDEEEDKGRPRFPSGALCPNQIAAATIWRERRAQSLVLCFSGLLCCRRRLLVLAPFFPCCPSEAAGDTCTRTHSRGSPASGCSKVACVLARARARQRTSLQEITRPAAAPSLRPARGECARGSRGQPSVRGTAASSPAGRGAAGRRGSGMGRREGKEAGVASHSPPLISNTRGNARLAGEDGWLRWPTAVQTFSPNSTSSRAVFPRGEAAFWMRLLRGFLSLEASDV
ncbi:uncharacterized protein LOC127538683 [Antechinus flavipes]|uniref:uncharacterized protein LOC127538683 n=1 Tax=Antechinus flavipes TaxID=38775 RepID=UPI002236BBD4|nr:uncharacterized protein LOC127538683 [Antechinus flavipes]